MPLIREHPSAWTLQTQAATPPGKLVLVPTATQGQCPKTCPGPRVISPHVTPNSQGPDPSQHPLGLQNPLRHLARLEQSGSTALGAHTVPS